MSAFSGFKNLVSSEKMADIYESTWRRGRLKCDGTGTETRFRLSAKWTSLFKSAGASVQSTTGSRGMRNSGSNAGYTIFWGSVRGTGYPFHSPLSPFTYPPVRHRVPSHFNWSLLTLMRSDRRLGVRVIAEELNVNRETVRQIVKEDLGMRNISAKMVPRILTHDQKQRRLHISSDLLRNAEMFDRVITGDETWCFKYDPGIKRQSLQWKTQNSSRPKKARMSQSQFKTMLLCFFDHKGVVHYEFIAQGQTVNQQCYLEMLIRLRNLFGGKDPESGLIIGFSTMIMPHAHDALRVCEFLAKNCITEMDHPPYSPDLVPCNFWLFPKLKKCPERTKICWPSWHPTQRENVTARYSENRFSRLFPAVAPSSHELHSFTRNFESDSSC